MTQPRNRLRERFPLPGTTHDGRNPLSAEGFALLSGLLQLDPSRRPTAEEALNHPWCALRCLFFFAALITPRPQQLEQKN